MANNLLEWSPPNNGNPAKVRALLKLDTPAAFNLNLPQADIPGTLFKDFFMPYAEANWPYDGGGCNCQDLAQALAATYLYVKKLRADTGIAGILPELTPNITIREEDCVGVITKPLRAVGGRAPGNVLGSAGGYDGRCYFPNHWFCKIGNKYYDPTFDLETDSRQHALDKKITQDIGLLRICKEVNRTIVYARDTERPAPAGFNSFYVELDRNGWISAEDWKTKTQLGFPHNRFGKLDAVDRALKSFEDSGYSSFAILVATFRHWTTVSAKDAKARNKGGCVNELANFLGLPSLNYPIIN